MTGCFRRVLVALVLAYGWSLPSTRRRHSASKTTGRPSCGPSRT